MFINGLLIGLSLIVAIGPQNAFVIRQGLSRNLAFFTAFLVFLCDSLLISAGVLGVGQFLTKITWLKILLTIAGALFLTAYGMQALLRVIKTTKFEIDPNKSKISYKTVIARSLAFSLLNPHAILDTLVIIGSISAQYNFVDSMIFGSGAIVASFIWFFLLALVAKVLSRYLQRPITWKFIDFFIGCVCLQIAYTLFVDLVG